MKPNLNTQISLFSQTFETRLHLLQKKGGENNLATQVRSQTHIAPTDLKISQACLERG